MNATSTGQLVDLPEDDIPPARVPMAAPSAHLAALEQAAMFEFLVFMASTPMLCLMGRGDGHPVMVLPGFAGDDHSTAPLRWILRTQGYSVHGWRQGRNLHRTAKIVHGLPRWLLELHEQHQAKVSLVGWSGGGIWARELARQFPFAVRQVITLGSPFRLRPGDTTRADSLADLLLGDQIPQEPSALIDEDQRPPVPVPVTAIYTRTDGVAHWTAGIESDGPLRENIEVLGSHSGLGHNPTAVIAVANRLAQPEAEWERFRAPAFVSHLFPPPAYWTAAAPRGA
jgi:pimeloyl-ACP methyl ester carboxylesterase